jgi:hypothetical protein
VIGRAAIAGNVNFGNAETGIGSEGVDAAADRRDSCARSRRWRTERPAEPEPAANRTVPSSGGGRKATARGQALPQARAGPRRALPGCTDGRSRLPREAGRGP